MDYTKYSAAYANNELTDTQRIAYLKLKWAEEESDEKLWQWRAASLKTEDAKLALEATFNTTTPGAG